jgi:serine/threonine-protein kinase RsbW
MSVLTREYTDLDRALDEVRSVLEEWSASQDTALTPNAETVRYTQLVLHEWIANLLQHADFQGRAPNVTIRLKSENRHIICAVVDNSEGFDLAKRLPERADTMDDLPERGMGLRIINACTDSLSYTSTEAGRYRFEFSIPADHDPWLSMLF